MAAGLQADRGRAATGAHTGAHPPVRSTRMSPDDLAEVNAARAARAEAEDLEQRARAARARLGGHMRNLVGRGHSRRAVARLLDFASDNTVRRALTSR